MEVMLEANHEEVHFSDLRHADLIETLFRTSVVRYGHYKLPDGTHTGVGFSRRRLCRVRWVRETVARGVAQVASTNGDYDVVAATGSSGLVFAKAVAGVMDLPVVGIPRPRWPHQGKSGNGLNRNALDPYEGNRVLVVETVTVLGHGLKALVRACENARAEISTVVVLMARIEIAPGALRHERQRLLPKVVVIFGGAIPEMVWQPGECPMCKQDTMRLLPVE